MVGFFFCIAAFALAFAAGRRSLLAGLCATLAVGYAYGFTRAVAPSSASHFIFDCAALGLYAAQLFRAPADGAPRESNALRLWVMALCAWPILLIATPTQDPAIQFVGLRAAIFLLPFVLLGARLGSRDTYRLALWCAVLNLVAFGVAAAEFTFGLERFLPHNAVTALVYQQHDVGGHLMAPRIPSIFPTASAYGGTMVVTLPLLLGAWARRGRASWERMLLLAAMMATGLGVFLAAARTHTVVLFVVLLVTIFSGRFRIVHRVGAVLAIVLVGVLVSREQRLQRFTTLQDTDYVAERVSWSVNGNVIDILAAYPFGNGLGGGGTNIPYFLRTQVRNPIAVENEYAKIALEQGFPGLLLWILFVVWAFARRASAPSDPWHLGRRLAWWTGVVYFGTAWMGLGLLSSIPQAAILLLGTGWVIGQQPRATRAVARAALPPLPASGSALLPRAG